ncbi:hypothetical protein QYF36_019869 [Acer negundo]|nr:hypothetical protein QYF36_019869 [Acer negundo]
MHVYGWPIVSKVASVGWDSRRCDGDRKEETFRGNRTVNESFIVGEKANFRRDNWEEDSEVGKGRNMSFVEVVSGGGSKDRVEASKEMVDITWVKPIIRICGFRIVLFDSVKACSDFINNRSLWENNFSSMEQWSFRVVTKSRPSWINLYGVPLCHWNSGFFCKMGSAFGDFLLIDDRTLLKKDLYARRVLALNKNGDSCPKKIRVGDGNGSFLITVEEDRTPVSLQWIEEFLELKGEDNQFFEKEKGQLVSAAVGGQRPYLVGED